jgi:multicomponent K+:H+ antiporter subunit C
VLERWRIAVEFLVAVVIGVMTAVGVYLTLARRTFPVVVGLVLLTYATNLFLFASGRLAVNQPDIVTDPEAIHADPLPQALVLTAIVISFGMTALLLVLAVRGYFESGGDDVNLLGTEEEVARGRT